MMEPYLSICLGVYNQGEILRENLEFLDAYKGDDVEIIISDNCSQEDIKGIVQSFSNKRMHYIRTDENVGQDRNLIHAMRYAKGKYIMLLRTKDELYPHEISRAIHYMKEHESVGYFLFSSNDELDIKRLYYSDKIYRKGREAYASLEKLLVHPSGQIYKRSLLDLDEYERMIKKNFCNNKSFIVHELIRMHIASKSELGTSSIVLWRYAVTARATSVSQLAEDNKLDVHIPDLDIERYATEFEFADKYIHDESRLFLLKREVYKWYRKIVFLFEVRNKNMEMHRHYGTHPIEFNRSKINRLFVQKSLKLFQKLSEDERAELTRWLRLLYFPIRWGMPIKHKIMDAIRKHI